MVTFANEVIENLMPPHKLSIVGDGAAPLRVPSIAMDHVNHKENGNIIAVKNRGRNSPPFDLAVLSSAHFATSVESADDDDASNITSITLQLREAAMKTIRHVESFKAAHAAIPLEVKVAMLEKEFPPVWISIAADEGDVDSTKATHPVSYERTEGTGEYIIDCVNTLLASEVLHLRQAMHTYEKQRMASMMQSLSEQMNSFHELLDENQRLNREISNINTVKDNRIAELENAMIGMKLDLAQLRNSEDHYRLNIVRLGFDLKKAHAEIHSLHKKFGVPVDMPNELRAGRTSYVPRRRLSKSLTSAGSPDAHVRRNELHPKKDPLLSRSWSIKDILDKSIRKENQNKATGISLMDKSPRRDVESSQKSPTVRPGPPAARASRSRSLVESTKARALIEAEFMPWGREKDYDGSGCRSRLSPEPIESLQKSPTVLPGPHAARASRSRSFVEPTRARGLIEAEFMSWGCEIGDEGSGCHSGASDARSTLSHMTDITYEPDRGNSSSADDLDKGYNESLLAHGIGDRLSLLASRGSYSTLEFELSRLSRGSYSTLEFEPAKPQLQKAMSLRRSEQDKTAGLHGRNNGKKGQSKGDTLSPLY